MKKRVILLSIILLVIGVIFINNKKQEDQILDVNTLKVNEKNTPVLAMYKNDTGNTKDDQEITEMPTEGYEIDTDRSYCYTTNKNEHDEVDLHTNDNGEHIISQLKDGSKCFLYFKKIITPTAESTLANLFKDFTTAESGTNFKAENGVLKVTGIDEGYHAKTLYKAEDNDGTSYFFRGQAPDNWVKFAGKRWRIIRINGDGTIRMIFQCSGDSCTDTTGTVTNAASKVAYNVEPNNDNTYVGYYNFGETSKSYEEAHTGTNPSTIADKVNKWYENNLTNYEQYIDPDAGFCNDRQKVTGVWSGYDGTGVGTSQTSYAAWGRVAKNGSNRTEQLPTLKCGVSAATADQQETSVDVDDTAYQRDLFTKTGANKGNQILPHPIGLITVDEVLLAGGFYGSDNSSYYLYTNQYYWTMSPSYVLTLGHSYVLYMTNNGNLNGSYVHWTSAGVRPVINLKANITFSGGNGSSSKPFVVATT